MRPSVPVLFALALCAACTDPGVEEPTPAAPPTLEVMTFNIRYDLGLGGSDPDAWANPDAPRRERALTTLAEVDPDIFGVQEALYPQVLDLEEGLPEYAWYGVGRESGGLAGEFSAVYWRRSRFLEADSGTFWLSETPDVPGTVFPGSATLRIASWVRLVDRDDGDRELLVLNTHWDHESQESRERSAALVVERIAELGDERVLVTGDMNATEESVAIGTLLASGLLDAYRAVHPDRQPDEATFHGFDGEPEGSRIDFVLHTADRRATAAEIVRREFDGLYPSDHFPVTASLEGLD